MTTERLVRSIARRFATSAHPEEDLAQELRLKALKVGDSAILPIALKRHAIDLVTGNRQWTGHQRTNCQPPATVPLEWVGEGSSTGPGDRGTDVRSAVRSLPHGDRLYVWHRFYEDQSNLVAAQRAGVSKNRWPIIRDVLAERLKDAA